jgi:transketolase
MRNKLAKLIYNSRISNDKIIFLTADLGFNVFDKFRLEFKSSYYNVGISEANLVSVAAGLAKEGYLPIIYSIASFMTARPYEQLRVLAGYNELKMIVIGAGGGLSYSKSGPTHHALDDLGLMTLIPNFNVLAPSGPTQLEIAFNFCVESTAPSYIQIGKFDEPNIPFNVKEREDNKADIELLILSTGTTSNYVYTSIIKNLIVSQGIKFEHVLFFRPFDENKLYSTLEKSHKILIIEDHWETGGLYSLILRMLKKINIEREIHRLGPEDRFLFEFCNENKIRENNGYDSEHVISFINSLMATK